MKMSPSGGRQILIFTLIAAPQSSRHLNGIWGRINARHKHAQTHSPKTTRGHTMYSLITLLIQKCNDSHVRPFIYTRNGNRSVHSRTFFCGRGYLLASMRICARCISRSPKNNKHLPLLYDITVCYWQKFEPYVSCQIIAKFEPKS